LPDERLLECYKKDQQKVERGFRFLKDPVFLSSTLFLKTPRRIMALCLLVYAAVQWRVRQALQHSQQTYPDQKGKPNPRPTARRVFQSFIDISVLHVLSLKTFVVGLTAPQKPSSHCSATAMSLCMPIPGEGCGMAAIGTFPGLFPPPAGSGADKFW
jgi:hypothetical protein